MAQVTTHYLLTDVRGFHVDEYIGLYSAKAYAVAAAERRARADWKDEYGVTVGKWQTQHVDPGADYADHKWEIVPFVVDAQ